MHESRIVLYFQKAVARCDVLYAWARLVKAAGYERRVEERAAYVLPGARIRYGRNLRRWSDETRAGVFLECFFVVCDRRFLSWLTASGLSVRSCLSVVFSCLVVGSVSSEGSRACGRVVRRA